MSKYINFKAGYICDAVAHTINTFRKELKDTPDDKKKASQISGLLESVSSFDVLFPHGHSPNYKNLPSGLAVAHNIISRGLPTKAPLLLEKVFKQVGLVHPNQKEYEFSFFDSVESLDFQTIFELLHIIEPDLEISRAQYAGDLGSEGEWDFLHEKLNDFPFAKQILQSERDFATINKGLAGERRVDFSFEIPYHPVSLTEPQRKGIIFEYDGSHHNLFDYKIYDKYRDDFAEEVGFETLRQSANEKGLNRNIEQILKTNIFSIFDKNLKRDRQDFLREYTLLFVPLSVARIQKTLLEYLIANPNLLSKEKVKLAVVERDFPCGALAVEYLKQFFQHLNLLLDENAQCHFPEIELSVFQNEAWVYDQKLHYGANLQDENFFRNEDFDIIIDHSALRRSGIYKETTFTSTESIKIRSSHFIDRSFGQSRRVYCADLLQYQPLVIKQDSGDYLPIEDKKESINFFIQNIFRKKEYRDGQLPIISRALQTKPVIGLMPTGGGKSLTFQLAAFLQPGLCLVVDPIKSLMEDQVRVLRSNWIDCCDFINSNLDGKQKRKKLVDFRYGESMFLFVSPERLVMDEFRTIVKNIDASDFGLAFSYCVIDEVHCVSEWGHDFRSTYLMLGKNSQHFLSTKSKKPVTLIGLTATASFDVLADIERELDIKHEDLSNAVIMIENTIRPELFFRVIDVTGQDRMLALNADFEKMPANLKRLNQKYLLEQSQEHHFYEFDRRDFASKKTKDLENHNIKFEYKENYLLESKDIDDAETFCSIVFCPVRGQVNSRGNQNPNGVLPVHDNLKSSSKGYFFSTDSEKENVVIQKHFSEFTNDNTKHIICTKAFGMGIDKADIRSTYHFVYSSSLESFVQEAGRAGRDKKIAESVVLLSKGKSYWLSHECLSKSDPKDKKLDIIKSTFYRSKIRRDLLGKEFPSSEELILKVRETVKTFTFLDVEEQEVLVKRLVRFQEVGYSDRSTHNYFYKNAFRGKDTERGQAFSLFHKKEFTLETIAKSLEAEYNENNETRFEFNYWLQGNRLYVKQSGIDVGFVNFNTGNRSPAGDATLLQIKNFIVAEKPVDLSFADFFNGKKRTDIPKQDTLLNTFQNGNSQTFDFHLAAEKKYPETVDEICEMLGINPNTQINPPNFIKTYRQQVTSALNYSQDFMDFCLMLEEIGSLVTRENVKSVQRHLQYFYNRDRLHNPGNDTGRLIYRMYCMGFLENYEIDYRKNSLFKCTFRKYDTIQDYINKVEVYLRRYVSEVNVNEKIRKLKERCNKPTVIENILECLYYLSEFAYSEIATKRKRATDEIESILNDSITDKEYVSNSFAQNKFIKEQIYFYFNAQYARRDFRIAGDAYSLLDDYTADTDKLNKKELLDKYLNVFDKAGTEQNNYKHMIGSCKKILRSLAESDLEKEWILRLLKAFAMYGVNNPSYISEANGELERGFKNLYADTVYHNDNFRTIEDIFTNYFAELQNNLQEDNPSFRDIEVIRLKLLLELQTLAISKMTEQYKNINYA